MDGLSSYKDILLKMLIGEMSSLPYHRGLMIRFCYLRWLFANASVGNISPHCMQVISHVADMATERKTGQ